MSTKRIAGRLATFGILAALTVVVTACGKSAPTRGFTTIPVGMRDKKCVVLNPSVSKLFARRGDTLTWLIVGTCGGKHVSVKRFRDKNGNEAVIFVAPLTQVASAAVQPPPTVRLPDTAES